MKAEVEVVCEKKQCPICTLDLPLAEFGVCRARKDGRNLYCKSCIRKKVTESRRALKEYKSARKKYISQQIDATAMFSSEGDDLRIPSQHSSRLMGKMSPVDRVRDAIRRGARTQKEIAQDTKMGKDEIGDALANLLLWTREIRTGVVDNARVYYINDSPESAIAQESVRIPRRKGDVPSSFSCLQGLMPGKKPEGEPEKIGGWVAA